MHYNNQPIGVVVADSLNAAWHAASLVRVRYRETAARLVLEAGFNNSYPGHHNEDPGDASWGDIDSGLARADIKVDQIYTTPIQHHSPMEPHAAIAQWEGDHLTLLCIYAKYYRSQADTGKYVRHCRCQRACRVLVCWRWLWLQRPIVVTRAARRNGRKKRLTGQ